MLPHIAKPYIWRLYVIAVLRMSWASGLCRSVGMPRILKVSKFSVLQHPIVPTTMVHRDTFWLLYFYLDSSRYWEYFSIFLRLALFRASSSNFPGQVISTRIISLWGSELLSLSCQSGLPLYTLSGTTSSSLTL